MNKVIGHLHTVNTHRHNVIKHCFKAGIPVRGLLHDLSKYSPVEFIPGCKYFFGDRSPTEGEREDYGYSIAWLHHKGRNRHHFEYWTDYDPVERCIKPVKMPLKFVVEMFCDRVAASKVYQGENYTDSHPLDYFMRGKARRAIHPETSDFIEGLFRMLSEQGEDVTFAYIRKYIKENDDY